MERYGYLPERRLRPNPRGGMVLGLLGVAYLLPLLDGTIVYVAMPLIQRELGFGGVGVHWVMTTYLLVFGGFLLFGGRLSERLGRRRMFMAGIAVFTAGSLLCGLAWSPAALLTGRAVQGVGAAVVAPTTLPLLVTHSGEHSGRGRALAVWTLIGAFAGTVGYVVGGPLVDGLGWQWIFLINVPPGLAVLCLGPFVLRDDEPTARRGYDLAGALTLTAAAVLLVFAVAGTAHAGWTSPRTIVLLVASAAMFTLFAGVETRAREPLLPVRLLRSRTRVGAALVLLTAGVGVEGLSFLLTLYTQHVLGFSATRFGLLMTIMTLSAVAGSFAGQAVVVRCGVRLPALVSMGCIGIGGLLLTTVSFDGAVLDGLLPTLLVLGTGLGAAFVSAQIAAVSGAADADSMAASGVVDATFSLGGALGLAALSSAVMTHVPRILADPSHLTPLELTPGIRNGFIVSLGFVVLGLVGALALPPRLAPCPPPFSQS